MIQELFDVFPEYIAFKILTYAPHKTAEIMRQHWDFIEHESNMVNVLTDIERTYDDMLWEEDHMGVTFGFYGYYMYNISPQFFNNITIETGRNFIYWYL